MTQMSTRPNDILYDFVNSKLELFTKLSQPEVNADLKRQLYQVYREQPPLA